MHAQTSDDARLEYRIFGSGARSIVLLHGWAMSGAVFDDLVALLDETRTRILVLDQRGSGSSSRPDTGYTLERYAEDGWAVIDDAGLHRPTLLGHSMGGQIAQLMAAARPSAVDGLLLLDPVPLAGLPLPAPARELFGSSAGDADKHGAILDIATKELEPSQRRRLIDIAVDVSEACVVESLDAWTAGGHPERAGEITARTLVVATDDDFLPHDLLRAEVVDRIPGARFEYLPGPGHYPQVERPRETAAIIEAFLDGSA